MRRWDLLAALGMLLPAGVVLGLYVYIGSFNRMLGDDYCTIYQGQHLGLLRSIWFWYLTWHGGFSASAADWFLSLWGSAGFPFHTLVFLSTWVGFAVITANLALKSRGYSAFRFLAGIFVAVLFVFTVLSLSPDVIQTVFWWGGARGYLSPLILFTLYFAFYLQVVASSGSYLRTGMWLLVSFGWVFFIGGFSETFTPVLVVFLAALTGIKWWAPTFSRKDISALFFGAGFLGALCSLFVMILAPGNAIRQAHFPAPPSLFTILKIAFPSYFVFLADIFTSPHTLTAILGAALGAVWLGMQLNRSSGVTPVRGGWIFAILLAGLILTFGCFPPAIYGTSEPPPERTLINPVFFLVASVLIAGFVSGEGLANRTWNIPMFSYGLSLVACGLIVFSSIGSFQTLSGMREEHRAFAQKWDRVDAQIREAKEAGLQQVNIPTMQNWANVEYPGDSLKNWVNLCYTKFYDINVLAPSR